MGGEAGIHQFAAVDRGFRPVEGSSEALCWRVRVVKVKIGGFVRSRGHLRLCVGELGWLK